jgi:hypothetical protein
MITGTWVRLRRAVAGVQGGILIYLIAPLLAAIRPVGSVAFAGLQVSR